jgi:DNA modification methylase
MSQNSAPNRSLEMNQIESLPVSDLIPYARNSRTHSDEQVTQIAASIREFGFTNPVLIDSNGTIIAGHGRVMAAKKVGLAEVPCLRLQHLSPSQIRAYVIADNKLALNAGWDDEMLKAELLTLQEEGFNTDLTGFSDDELNALLNSEIIEGQTDPDEIPEAPVEPVTKLGDIWILGNHRLMCGDSTSIDSVEKLLDGNSVDLIFTDPPYNVSFCGRSGNHDVIINDNLSDVQFEEFIKEVIQTIKAINSPNYYIWCNWKFYGILQKDLEYRSCIVWAKNVFGMGSNYRHQHEFCLFNGSIDSHIKNESDLWSVKKDTNYVHPTQKPVELSMRALGNHIECKNILDLFGGSGSTLIGCHKMNRNAFLMELDPKYCDVIVKRWEDFTGKKAVLQKV